MGLKYIAYSPTNDLRSISPEAIRKQGMEELFAGFYEKFSDLPMSPIQQELVSDLVREIKEADDAAD